MFKVGDRIISNSGDITSIIRVKNDMIFLDDDNIIRANEIFSRNNIAIMELDSAHPYYLIYDGLEVYQCIDVCQMTMRRIKETYYLNNNGLSRHLNRMWIKGHMEGQNSYASWSDEREFKIANYNNGEFPSIIYAGNSKILISKIPLT